MESPDKSGSKWFIIITSMHEEGGRQRGVRLVVKFATYAWTRYKTRYKKPSRPAVSNVTYLTYARHSGANKNIAVVALSVEENQSLSIFHPSLELDIPLTPLHRNLYKDQSTTHAYWPCHNVVSLVIGSFKCTELMTKTLRFTWKIRSIQKTHIRFKTQKWNSWSCRGHTVTVNVRIGDKENHANNMVLVQLNNHQIIFMRNISVFFTYQNENFYLKTPH